MSANIAVTTFSATTIVERLEALAHKWNAKADRAKGDLEVTWDDHQAAWQNAWKSCVAELQLELDAIKMQAGLTPERHNG